MCIFHGTWNTNRTLHEHAGVGLEIIISFRHVDNAVTERLALHCTAHRVLPNAAQTRSVNTLNAQKHRLYWSEFICCCKTSVKYISCRPLLFINNYQVIFRNSICIIGQRRYRTTCPTLYSPPCSAERHSDTQCWHFKCTETQIVLVGIYLLLQNISEIHLLPTVTA